MNNFTLYWRKSGKEQKYMKVLACLDIINLCPRDPKKCYDVDFEEAETSVFLVIHENIRLDKAI